MRRLTLVYAGQDIPSPTSATALASKLAKPVSTETALNQNQNVHVSKATHETKR